MGCQYVGGILYSVFVNATALAPAESEKRLGDAFGTASPLRGLIPLWVRWASRRTVAAHRSLFGSRLRQKDLYLSITCQTQRSKAVYRFDVYIRPSS